MMSMNSGRQKKFDNLKKMSKTTVQDHLFCAHFCMLHPKTLFKSKFELVCHGGAEKIHLWNFEHLKGSNLLS